MEEDLAYDKVQAKFCASLLWFVCRISEQNEASSIPSEITSPIEISEEHMLMVRPAIVEYLISGEMYFSVAQAIFNENMQSFWDLLQLMSLNAIYILDENGDPVTDYDLAEKFPFKMSAHLALMDCLMLAYANNIVSLEDLVACVKRISTFNASKELPFDLENAVLLWLNKVNYVNSGNFGRVREPKLKPKGANEPIRVRKDQLVERNVFPRLHNLLETLHDGKTLLSILLYYSPDTINIEDIKLSSVLSEDEKISNIELFRRLCAENVCTSVFALRIEDFYFRNDFMKNNFLALLCEVFVKMESMTKRNIANIVTSDSNVKSKTIEPFCEKTSPEKTARPFQQQKLPLLSKRSKQQLAIFEASLSRDVPPPTKDVHVHDLELQESVTVSSTVAMDKTETARSIAWGPQESKKSAKISLDFKPEMGVMQHSQKSFSMEDCCQPGMETIKSNRRGNYINKSQNEAFHSIINHAKENVNSAYPSAVHGDDHAVSDVEQDYEGRELTSHQNFQPARDLSTSCDLATDYKKIRSMYSLIPIETDPLTAGESVSSLPSAGEESDSSLVFASASVGTKVDLEDDALSTITEATEPEPDSHHVPLQSSANSFYAQNLVNDELESNQLPEFTAGVEATERMDDVNTEKSPFSRCVLGNASACLPGKKEIQTDNETGMSYTIDDGTLEEAIASGIPIIAKTELHNNSTSSKTYFDLNSSQEISVMQSDVSLPTGSFCGSETMHIHVDTKASYDADVRLQYSKSMLSHSLINGSNLDVHMQTIENNKKNDIFVESLNNTKENYTKSAVKGDKNYKPSPPEMDDIFSSISYEHWPFIKEFSKNNFTLRKNGRDMICERLNNTKNDNHGQLYTSWSDQSKKNAYFSLEARESRLQQIRERRLNWTAKCTKHPTTSWAEISLQRQKLAEDGALDTGISIIDTLAQLSDIADDGDLDRTKCLNSLQLDVASKKETEGELRNDSPDIISEDINSNNDIDESIHQDHERTASTLKSHRYNKEVAADHNNNKENDHLKRRGTFVLGDSPIKTMEEATSQGIPIIAALGDLCNVADDFLKDYEHGDPSNENPETTYPSGTLKNPKQVDLIINTKVNEILESFKKLDSTVDMIKKKALKDHLSIYELDSEEFVTKLPEHYKDLLKTSLALFRNDNFDKSTALLDLASLKPPLTDSKTWGNNENNVNDSKSCDSLQTDVSKQEIVFRKRDKNNLGKKQRPGTYVIPIKNQSQPTAVSLSSDEIPDNCLTSLAVFRFEEELKTIENIPINAAQSDNFVDMRDKSDLSQKERPSTYVLPVKVEPKNNSRDILSPELEEDLVSGKSVSSNSISKTPSLGSPRTESAGEISPKRAAQIKSSKGSILNFPKEMQLFSIDVDIEPISNIEQVPTISRNRPGTYVLSKTCNQRPNYFDRNNRPGTYVKEKHGSAVYADNENTKIALETPNYFDRKNRPGTYVKEKHRSEIYADGENTKIYLETPNYFDRKNRPGTYVKERHGSEASANSENTNNSLETPNYFERKDRPGTYVLSTKMPHPENLMIPSNLSSKNDHNQSPNGSLTPNPIVMHHNTKSLKVSSPDTSLPDNVKLSKLSSIVASSTFFYEAPRRTTAFPSPGDNDKEENQSNTTIQMQRSSTLDHEKESNVPGTHKRSSSTDNLLSDKNSPKNTSSMWSPFSKNSFTRSQPNLLSLTVNRSISIGTETVNNLNNLKNAMSASLFKLHQLHDVQRHISLSNSTLIGSDDDLKETNKDESFDGRNSPATDFFFNAELKRSASAPAHLNIFSQISSREKVQKKPEISDCNISNMRKHENAEIPKSDEEDTMKGLEDGPIASSSIANDDDDKGHSPELFVTSIKPEVVLREKRGRKQQVLNCSTYVLQKEQPNDFVTSPSNHVTPSFDNCETTDEDNDTIQPSPVSEYQKFRSKSFANNKSIQASNQAKKGTPQSSTSYSQDCGAATTIGDKKKRSMKYIKRRSGVDKNNRPRSNNKTVHKKTDGDDTNAEVTEKTTSLVNYKKKSRKELNAVKTGRKDVPLSSRLAALRMQLEEKRRQFEEEKKRKLKEWREERAETLQNTFFVSFDGKENIDPTDNKPVSSDDQTALPTRSRSSSVKEFIHQKQLEKSISKKTLTSENNSENTWFVDFKGGEQQEGRVNALAPPDPPEDTAIPTSLHSSNTFIDDKLTKRDEGVADEEPAEAPTTVDIVTGNQDLDEEMREETTQPATVAQAMEVVEKREEANINDEKIVDIHSPSILTSANMGIVENIESSLAKMNLNVVEVTDTNENKEFVPPIHSSTITQLPVPFPGEQEKKQDKVATSLSDVIINEELPEEQHTEIKQDITTAETSEVKELLEETPPKPMTWDCTVDEKLITTPSLTPAQQKKKERFIRNRQKKMEEEKQKKEAQLEKKQQEEMELLIQMKETEERQTEYRRQQQQQQQQQQRRREQEVVAAQQELHSMQRGIGTAEKSVRKKVEEPSSKVTSMGTPRQSSIPNASEPTDDNIGQNNLFSGYNGPSAYQKPTGKSNRKIIQNAITHCCLSGGVNNDAKVKCLEAMEKSEANHFVVLFRDGMKFRSVYEYYPEDETVTKIYGIGPKTITSKMTDKFYRYYSGGKKFDPLLMKDLSIQCDGLTIKKELWEKKQGTPSKISSNMRKKLR